MNSRLTRSSIPTPALVIDLDALERNISAMAAFAARAGRHLRPHVKTHKCVAIARLQIAAGAVGVSCATLDELAAMVLGGVPGLLLTSPIAGEPKFAQLHRLLQRDPDITVVADDIQAVTTLDTLAKGLGLRIRVLIDFDVGQRRTGCRSVEATVALYRNDKKVFETPPVRANRIAEKRDATLPVWLQVPMQMEAGKYDCQVNLVDEFGRKFAFRRTRMAILPGPTHSTGG